MGEPNPPAPYKAGPTVYAVLLFGLAVGALAYGLSMMLHWPFGLPQLGVVGFLTLLSAVLLTWQESGLAKDPKGFMFRFMTGLVLKMLSALLVVAVILIALPRAEGVPLALLFALLYLMFLAFSTIRLNRISRKGSR